MFELMVEFDPKPMTYKVFQGKICVPDEIWKLKEILSYKAMAKMNKEGIALIDKPCEFFLYVCRPMNPTMHTFGDGDNYCKWVADALNGIVYKDDALIQAYHIYKMSAATPCVLVRVVPLKSILLNLPKTVKNLEVNLS